VVAVTLTVAVPPPEPPLKKTALAEVGTLHPPAPPEVSDHSAVSFQFPTPPTQYRVVKTQLSGVSSMAIASPVAQPATLERVITVPTEVWVSTVTPFQGCRLGYRGCN